MLDIANSMYGQVKALRGGAVEVDETPGEGDPGDEDELTEWGRAPKNATTKLKARKLQLYICDGKEELYAFEYRPLPQLTGMIFPGVKVEQTTTLLRIPHRLLQYSSISSPTS